MPNNNSGFGSFGSNSSFGSFGKKTAGTDPSVQDLLLAALAAGGAPGQVAMEIANPNTGVLPFVREKLGDMFHTVVDTLRIPSNAIAALISPSINYEEARKKDITPADVLFGTGTRFASEYDENGNKRTLPSKVAATAMRTATDILLDPLTYLTFGSNVGVFGMSKLGKITVGEETAKVLGIKTVKTADGKQLGLVDQMLSYVGQDVFTKTKTRLVERFRSEELRRFVDIGTKMLNASDKRFEKMLTNIDKADGYELSSNYILAKHVQSIRKMQKPVGMTEAAFKSQQKSSLTKAILDTDKALQDNLVRRSLNLKRADIEDEAREIVSDLIEQSVKRNGGRLEGSMAESLIDKGGIKFAGKSILSAARIRAVSKYLPEGALSQTGKLGPLMTLLNHSRSLFSTKYNATGRVPDFLLKESQKFRDTRATLFHKMGEDLKTVYERLGITQAEDELLMSAITLREPPADPFLESIYYLVNHGDDQSIRNFVEKIDKVPEQFVKSAQDKKVSFASEDFARRIALTSRQIHKTTAAIAKAEIEQGINIWRHQQYMPMYGVDQKITNTIKSKLGTGSNDPFSKMSSLVAYRSVDNPSKILYGYQGEHLQKFMSSDYRESILRELRRMETYNKSQYDKVVGDIRKFRDKLRDKAKAAVMEQAGKVVKSATGDKGNEQAFLKVIEDRLPEPPIKQMLERHIKENFRAGFKIKGTGSQNINDIDEVIENITKQAAEGDYFDMDNAIRIINEKLEKLGQKKITQATKDSAKAKRTAKSSTAEAVNQEDKELLEMLRDHLQNGKMDYIKREIDTTNLDRWLVALTEEFYYNPKGVEKILDALAIRKARLTSVMNDWAMDRKIAEKEAEKIGRYTGKDGRSIFVDNDGKLYERVRATYDEVLEHFGLDRTQIEPSAFKALYGRVQAGSKAIASRELLNTISKKFGVIRSLAPSDYVPVDIKELQEVNKGFSSILRGVGDNGPEDLFFHPEVANHIQELFTILNNNDDVSKIGNVIDHLQNYMKGTVTSIWPAFHGRNALSNVFLAFSNLGANVFKPRQWVMTGTIMRKKSVIDNLRARALTGDAVAERQLIDELAQPFLTDKSGTQYTVGEMLNILQNNVIAFQPNIIGHVDLTFSPQDVIDHAYTDIFEGSSKALITKKVKGGKRLNPRYDIFDANNELFKWGRWTGNQVEGLARIHIFLNNLEQSGDVLSASRLTKEFLFDYQNLTHFERSVMRRAMFFYTFSRKNLELQAKLLFGSPGRITGPIHAVKNIGDVFGGGALSEEERQQLPEYLRNGLVEVANRDGENFDIIANLGLPYDQPYQSVLSPRQLMNGLSPIWKIPIEVTSGYSFYHGKPISEVTNATGFKHLPEVVKNFIGYVEVDYTDKKTGEVKQLSVALRPNNLYVFNAIPLTSRSISELKRLDSGDKTIAEKALRSLTGMSTTTLDMNLEEYRRTQELEEQLKKVLDDADIGYEFNRFYIKPQYR